jgi:hypothetical protein
MPSQAEIEAAAKAMVMSDNFSSRQEHTATYFRYAEAALTAAEKVREEAEIEALNGEPALVLSEEARTQNIHTCHTDCPCQTGGEPVSDFLEARPETGQPIPDEARDAAYKAFIAAQYHAPSIEAMGDALTAALPHLEAAKDKQIEQLRAYLEARDKRIAELEEALDDQRKGWDESMAKVEADTLAKVRERVEGLRLKIKYRGQSAVLDREYNAALTDALNAIDEGEQ